MRAILSILSTFAIAFCITQFDSLPIESPTTLIDLPVELQMMIYKDLNITELIHLAKTHPNNQAVVELVFKDQYSNSKLVIDGVVDYWRGIFGKIVSRDSVSDVIDLETILETFQLFGHLIHKLRISYGVLQKHKQKWLTLNEHISKYLSQSLTEITLEFLYEDFYEGLQGSFTEAKYVTLSGNIRSSGINISEMFPVVRQLDLYIIQVDPESLEYHFPHLELLKFGGNQFKRNNPNDMASLEQCLKLNPQLRYLKFYWADFTILEIVSKNSPNLERIDINEFLDSSNKITENIHFNNLKAFTIRKSNTLSANAERVPIVFGNLEEFTCGQTIGLWFDVLLQNKQIKKLTTEYLDDEQFRRLAEECPNLEEFSIPFHHFGVTANEFMSRIRKFVGKANKLEKFSFLKTNYVSYDELIDDLKPKCNVTLLDKELVVDRG